MARRNFTNWHDAQGAGRGTCGVYVVRDRLSGRAYVGSSECCEYRLQLHEQRINRGSRNIPAGLKALAYTNEPVSLEFKIVLKVADRTLLEAAEYNVWVNTPDTTNLVRPCRKP